MGRLLIRWRWRGENQVVPGAQSRLEQRIRHDFPWPGSAHGVLRLLAELPGRAGYDEKILASETVRAAVVLLGDGDPGQLRLALDLAVTD